MKLRIQGDSLRLRLTRSEVARLRDAGALESAISFRSGESLIYRIQTAETTGPVLASFGGGAITVTVPADAVSTWADGDQVGLYARDGALAIAIEKDFRCLTRAGEEPDAYPNPAAGRC